jgi:SPP1 gp7 family putative phage head morphogenesis protein
MEASLMTEPYGTIAKYRNALAIKKHNAIIQPWASAMALDVAAVFWATWKGIEERLPEGDEILEAEKPRDSRDLKNKYSAIIRVEVKRHSAELQRVIENYIYRVWLAGAVEQCRDLGCTGWFFSSLSKSSTSSESASAPDGASLQESDIVFLGTFSGDWQIGAYRSDDGKTKYVAYNGSTYNKFSPTNGVGTPFKNGEIDPNATKSYAKDFGKTSIKTTKQGGDGLPYSNATSAYNLNAPKASSSKTSSSVGTTSVKADKSGWVSLPNLRAQEYAKKHAAEAVTQINDTTRKEIARIVSDGVKSGASYNDIAKAIKDKFEEFAVPMPQKHVSNRAVLVAVTELANAYCEGNAQVGNYLQDNGVKMMKAWQTLEDDRVSDGCKENERVGWIPINKEFPSGHMHPPRFPGCRCDFLQDILEEDMLGKPIDALYGKQYTNSAVNITKSSPSKTVSSQVQQVIPSKKTKAGKTASKRVDKSGAPKWDAWDLRGVEEKINSLRPKDYYIAMDAFEKGNVSEFASRAGEKIPEVVKLLSDKKKSFSSMPKPMKDSINTYTGSYYLQMNEYLRKGRKVNSLFSDRKVKINVENAEKAIKKYGVTSCPIVVNRGFDGDFWDSWEEGEIKQIPEFVSTSVKSTDFRRDNTAHIYVPPNRGCGIYVDGESKNPREWEYLIAPDSKFKVHHIEDNEWGGKDFWLELIP